LKRFRPAIRAGVRNGLVRGGASAPVFRCKFPRTKQQSPHLIFRGHTPGHSVDQLLRDWSKLGGTPMPFCPFLCTYRHLLTLLNRIATRLGVKGSQVQILSARQNRSSRRPAACGNFLFIYSRRYVGVLDPLTRLVLPPHTVDSRLPFLQARAWLLPRMTSVRRSERPLDSATPLTLDWCFPWSGRFPSNGWWSLLLARRSRTL
jgi:hypothetical protein